METQVSQSLNSLRISSSLAQSITTATEQATGILLAILDNDAYATPDHKDLHRQGIDSVLAVTVTEVGFSGKATISFHMVADIQIMRTANGEQSYKRQFVYQSDEYEARLWARNQANLLGEELHRAYDSLAESVVEQLFLLTGLTIGSRGGTGAESGLKGILGGRDACGLAWISPTREYRPDIRDTNHQNWNRFPLTANNQPTLIWEAFPREVDKPDAIASFLAGVGNVRYDLRVWAVVTEGPPKLIYERRGLPNTSHTLEDALPQNGRYFWSIRARFDHSGQVNGTKWGCFRSPSYEAHGSVKAEASPVTVVGALIAGSTPRDICTLDFIPSSNYYRFRTP